MGGKVSILGKVLERKDKVGDDQNTSELSTKRKATNIIFKKGGRGENSEEPSKKKSLSRFKLEEGGMKSTKKGKEKYCEGGERGKQILRP